MAWPHQYYFPTSPGKSSTSFCPPSQNPTSLPVLLTIEIELLCTWPIQKLLIHKSLICIMKALKNFSQKMFLKIVTFNKRDWIQKLALHKTYSFIMYHHFKNLWRSYYITIHEFYLYIFLYSPNIFSEICVYFSLN